MREGLVESRLCLGGEEAGLVWQMIESSGHGAVPNCVSVRASGTRGIFLRVSGSICPSPSTFHEAC